MGRVNHSKSTKKKCYKKALDVKRRPRDVDQIQDDLKREKELNQPMTFELDDDLPGYMPVSMIVICVNVLNSQVGPALLHALRSPLP